MLYDLLVLTRLHDELVLLGACAGSRPRRRVRYATLDAAMRALNLERLHHDFTLLRPLSLGARHRDVARDRVAASVVAALAHLLVLLDLVADVGGLVLLRADREIGQGHVLLLDCQQVLRRVVVQDKSLFLRLGERVALLTHVGRASLRHLHKLRAGPSWLARRAITGGGRRLDDHREVGPGPLRSLGYFFGGANGRRLLVLLHLLVAGLHVYIGVMLSPITDRFDPIADSLTVAADAVDISLTLQGKVALLAHVSVHILVVILGLNDRVLLIKQRHLLAASVDASTALAV